MKLDDDLKGGRGKCPYCKEWHNNVAYHQSICICKDSPACVTCGRDISRLPNCATCPDNPKKIK